MSKAPNPAAMATAAPKSILPPPDPASIAKLPMPAIDNAEMIARMKPQQSWFDKLWGKMDKDKMRETGVGLINQALMQQPQRTPMAPFQPGGVGAMGAGNPGGAAQPQLVALAQQLGLNRVQ